MSVGIPEFGVIERWPVHPDASEGAMKRTRKAPAVTDAVEIGVRNGRVPVIEGRESFVDGRP